MINPFQYKRRLSSEVKIGNTPLGGVNPIRIQSMATVSTMDTNASVEQAICIIDAGSEYVRFTAQGEREAANLANIRHLLTALGYNTPLIADIHFNPKAADVAAQNVEKVRINPGNYVELAKRFTEMELSDEDYMEHLQQIRARFIPFLNLCRNNNTAIRIGVNHGSLSDRVMSRYGDTAEGMVASCMEFLRICEQEQFHNVVISMKASNTLVMVQSVRLLIEQMDAEGMKYPLHLGVTEAGDQEDGRIKSAVGIGTLLADGIGDTIRVSLSENPEAEIPVARKLVNYITKRENHPLIKAESANFKRTTHQIADIGGHQPIVISDRSNGESAIDKTYQPDFIYVAAKTIESDIPQLVDALYWNANTNSYPYFRAKEIEDIKTNSASIKFLELTYPELKQDLISLIKNDQALVLILNSTHVNPVGEIRAIIGSLQKEGITNPVVLRQNYKETDKENLQIKAAADFGALLLDGIGNGILLKNEGLDTLSIDRYMFGILQATRLRISKTEYISCPGCGRTLYDLQQTIARVKAATDHLKGLKIGIMGCIVNGPGEMADADYGYVGAGKGKISLYKNKECIVRNIPEDEAVEQLILLIKQNGDWKEVNNV